MSVIGAGTKRSIKSNRRINATPTRHADLKRGNRAKNVDAFQREFASAFERSTPIGTPIPSAQAAVDAGLLFLRPSKVFDKGNWKEQKICCGCCRPLTWRKKWERDWENVKHCSERCRRNRSSASKET